MDTTVDGTEAYDFLHPEMQSFAAIEGLEEGSNVSVNGRVTEVCANEL